MQRPVDAESGCRVRLTQSSVDAESGSHQHRGNIIGRRGQKNPSCFISVRYNLEFVEAIKDILIFMFFHIFIKRFVDCLGSSFDWMTNYICYAFSCFANGLKIERFIIGIKEIAIWKILAVSVVGIKHVAS